MGKDIDLENEIEKEAAEAEVEEETAEEAAEETAEEVAEETEEAAEEAPAAENAGGDTEKLKKELAEQKDKYLRLMAEYDNYRKRTAKQKLETRDAAVGDTELSFIKIYYNF